MVGPYEKLVKRVAAFGLALGLLAAGCGAMAQKFEAGYQVQRSYEAGVERYRAGDYVGAIPHFQRVLAVDPLFDEAEAHLAWSFYHTGQYMEATRHFRQAIARQPKGAELYDGLGWSRYQVKRYHLALEAFRRALALDPSYRDAAVGFAYNLLELGRYAEALPHLERLTREGEGQMVRSPTTDVEEVRSRYAWTLFYLGEFEKARGQFMTGLAARPNWSGLHNGLGWTYLRLGDKARARPSFQRALQLQPDYPDAKEGLAQASP